MQNPLEVTTSPRVTEPPTEQAASIDQVTRARVIADLRRKEAEVADRRRRDEEKAKAEAESIEKLKRDMKGKKYTLDEFGQPIAVRRVNAANLPPPFQAVELSVPSSEAAEPAVPLVRRSFSSSPLSLCLSLSQSFALLLCKSNALCVFQDKSAKSRPGQARSQTLASRGPSVSVTSSTGTPAVTPC
jgi:hypothetical protein